MTPIKSHEDYSVLCIWATPGAAKDRIGEIVLDSNQQPYLKIYVTAIAEKGLANKSIINFLSRKFGVAKSLFQVISGQADRKKRLRVNIRADDLRMILKETTGSLF